jgi:hypothetical protein
MGSFESVFMAGLPWDVSRNRQSIAGWAPSRELFRNAIPSAKQPTMEKMYGKYIFA